MQRLILIAAALLCLAPCAAQAQSYGNPNSLVEYWYRMYLGRAPDPGMAGWVNQLNLGVPPDKVLAAIVGSPEFYSRSGSTPQGYITQLYNNFVGRPPTFSELNFWVRRMYTEDRPAIADQILTQNPGVWVGSSRAVPPPVVRPQTDLDRRREWERDRHGDWDRHHDIHEYRRPDLPFHRDEHHDDHR